MRAECALVACYWLMTSGKYSTMFVNSYRTVTDGQSPVDVAAELLPDVLVPDVSMRILNGIHAARRMLEGNPCIEVVFLTICEDPDTCRAALELGAFGYAIKPCLAIDLIPAIEHARDGRRFVSPGCE